LRKTYFVKLAAQKGERRKLKGDFQNTISKRSRGLQSAEQEIDWFDLKEKNIEKGYCHEKSTTYN
jgi:hypothetical protein